MSLPLSLVVGTLVRMAAVAVIFLYLWPMYALPQFREMGPLDRAVSNAARITLFLIAVGYVLVALHLFEWVSLAVCLFLLRLTRPRRRESPYVLAPNLRLAAALLEELDDLAGLPRRLRREASGRVRAWLQAVRWPGGAWVAASAILLPVVAVSAWMRFWMNWSHAALPFSDAYVVLYWMKGIDNQLLFPNGIYPEGFHIFMAELAKLGLANAVVFEKFFGPAVGLAMALSVGYTTYRLSGRAGPAIVALLIYGTLPFLLPYTLDRQAATDSQEFGNALVLPVAFFTYQAWVRAEKGWRVTALSLLATVAFVHTLALANAVGAFAAGSLAAWLVKGVSRPTASWFAKYLALAVLGAVLPIGIALAMGNHVYGSSASFLMSHLRQAAPPIATPERIAFASPLALFAVRLVQRRPREALGMPLVGLFLMTAAALVQEAPLFGFNSLVLETRYGEYLALTEALAFGLGWSALEESLAAVTGWRAAQWVSVLASGVLAAYAWRADPPRPPNPYTMNSDAFVAQYVRIATHTTPTTWLVVAEDQGFALAYGEGYEMAPQTWVAHVKPVGRWPRYDQPGQAPTPVGESVVFFFVHRAFHAVNVPGERARLAYEEAGNRAIEAWLRAWQKDHPPLKVYYRGRDLVVYELQRKASSGETKRRIFGGG